MIQANRSGLPVMGFLGMHSGGRHGVPPSQNEIVAGLFRKSGGIVRTASTLRRPLFRTLHQLGSVLWWRDVEVLIVSVFSGRSFLLAELATPLGHLVGKHVVLFLHGGELPKFGTAHRKRVERLLAQADRIVAPSTFLARVFHEWGYDLTVIPNVIERLPATGAVRDPLRPRVLWMRTFHEHYDPVSAVRAFALAVRVRPDLAMTMAGADHGLEAQVRAEARRLGVDDRIEFPGFLNSEAKQEAFERHDIFLNTNVVDNTPVSVIEAASHGLVVVATSVGGIPDLLTDGVDAVLVQASDPEATSRAILDVLDDPERGRRLSQGALTLAAASEWPSVRKRWEHELGFVVPGGARASRSVGVSDGHGGPR
ncbi:MAG: glycosyltransferase family 4 protein [Microthrixaceae bacterium]